MASNNRHPPVRFVPDSSRSTAFSRSPSPADLDRGVEEAFVQTDAWLRGLEMGQALARGSAFGARAVQTEGSVLKSLPAD